MSYLLRSTKNNKIFKSFLKTVYRNIEFNDVWAIGNLLYKIKDRRNAAAYDCNITYNVANEDKKLYMIKMELMN